MLSFPVLKVLDRTTKVLVDREEKGLGMDMVRKLFGPSCGSGDGVCEPGDEDDEWESPAYRMEKYGRAPSPDPPKRHGIIVQDRLFRDEFSPFPTGTPVRTFQVTYNNRYKWETLFDASANTYCKLDISEYEQEAGKPNVFMIRGRDNDYYLSTDNITNDGSWQVREVGETVIFFDVYDSSRRQVDQFRFIKVREYD